MNYKPLIFEQKQIIALYNENNWTSYTKHPKQLIQGLKHSLYSYAAYDDNTLVGLIRVVGDGETIIYVQDILVLPKYQRKHIGTTLINHILARYAHVRQIILTTDQTKKQKAFYEQCGFKAFNDLSLTGYYYEKKT
jgi:GNAT superfamily N-acetyltransferase